MRVLGFDSFTLSTAERPSISDLPVGGLFIAATPENLRRMQQERELLDYLTERAAYLIEPDPEWLH
jgi:hypothetical protein